MRLKSLLGGSWLAGGFLAGLLMLGGCETPPTAPAPEPGTPAVAGGGQVGSVMMSLTLAGGYHISHVTYDVSGNGFHTAKSLDVSNSSSFSTVIGGIPFGPGYLLQLTAQDSGHQLSGCQGASFFDVTTSGTVTVPVDMTCYAAPTVAAPPAVPIPRAAVFALAAMMLLLGAFIVRRVRDPNLEVPGARKSKSRLRFPGSDR
jgi:hypothetical protein